MLIGSPGYRWSIDLTGPHICSDGYTYIFTAVDPFSKFAVAAPIHNKEAETVARAFMDNVILMYGCCEEILTDQGPEFEAKLLAELLGLLDIHRLRTSGYHPRCNSVVEVWHKTLNSLLATVVAENQKDWSRYIPYVTFCYNATEHKSTGFSPYYIWYGREANWRVDILLGTAGDRRFDTAAEYVRHAQESIEYAYPLVRDSLRKCADTNNRHYNKRVHEKSFEPGDRVWLYSPRQFRHRSPKWSSYYREEAVVKIKLNEVTYIVRVKGAKKDRTAHIDKMKELKEWVDPTTPV
jgi:hypothetical protein